MTAIRPRGASRSVCTYRRPSRATHAPALRVEAHGHLDERRRRESRGRQVRDPHVGARRRPRGRGDDQPAPVAGDGHAVVVRVVEPRPEHLDVVGGRGADAVQPDAAVVLGLVLRQHLGGEPADVVERLPTRQPGHGGVPRPVDRPVDQLAGGHVHDVQHALLRPAGRHLVRHQVAFLGRLPRVERRRTGGVDHDGVEQDPFPVAVDDHDHGVLLVARPTREEPALAAPGGRAHEAGTEQGAEPGGQDVGGERAVGAQRTRGTARTGRPARPTTPRSRRPPRPPATGTGRRRDARAGPRRDRSPGPAGTGAERVRSWSARLRRLAPGARE